MTIDLTSLGPDFSSELVAEIVEHDFVFNFNATTLIKVNITNSAKDLETN